MIQSILSLTQSHQTYCSYTKINKEKILIDKIKFVKLNIPHQYFENNLNIDDIKRLEMWRCLCVLIGTDATKIIEFAKRIPGIFYLYWNFYFE